MVDRDDQATAVPKAHRDIHERDLFHQADLVSHLDMIAQTHGLGECNLQS